MLIDTQEAFEAALEQIKSTPGQIFVDCETTGLKPFLGDRLVGIALLMDQRPEVKFYFTFRHSNCLNLNTDSLNQLLQFLPSRTLINHNMKFDLLMLHCDGMQLPKRAYCTMLAAHLLDENGPLGLKELADKLIDRTSSEESYKLDLLLASRKLTKGQLHRLQACEVADYAIKDVVLAKKLNDILKPALTSWRLVNLNEEISKFLLAITRTEIRGMPTDVEFAKLKVAESEARLVHIEQTIKNQLGFMVNPNSPKQVCDVLGISSSSKADLDEYLKNTRSLANSELVKHILEYRKIAKEKGTYYNRIVTDTTPHGRLHGSFNISGTVSGRLSSSGPNLQNLPKSGKSEIKNAIRCKPGYKLIEADYSQLELRITAHYADISSWKEAFAKGVDIHQATADATGTDRHQAKTTNFGVLYGQQAKGLSEKLGMSLDECKQFLRKYHAGLPTLQPFIDAVTSTAIRNGYIRLFSGRVRHFNSQWANPKDAFNNLIQGSGAEATRIAITRLDEIFSTQDDPKIIATVHDSIVFELKDDEHINKHAKTIKTIMEDNPWCSVKLVAELKIGDTWGTLQPLEII